MAWSAAAPPLFVRFYDFAGEGVHRFKAVLAGTFVTATIQSPSVTTVLKEFLRSVPEFEHMLIRSGIILFKFYFSVSKEEQARRFHNRLNDPLKQWKLSSVDRAGQGKWDE